MSLVIDSSMTLAWYFEDENTESSLAILNRVASGLQAAVRRQRITKAYRDASLDDLRSLAIAIDPLTDHHAWSATLDLSDRYRLTPYDAAYLELASRLTLPLATLDEELLAACEAAGIAVA